MTGQTSQLHSRLTAMLDHDAIGRLAEQTGIQETKTVRRAVHLSLEPVLEAMHDFVRDDKGKRILSEFLELMPTEGIDGSQLAARLFENRLQGASESLAEQCGISAIEALAALGATCAWVLTQTASLIDDPQKLPRLLVSRRLLQSNEDSGRAEPVAAPVATGTSTAFPRSNTTSSTAASGSGKLIGAALAALLVVGGAIFAFGSGGGDAEPGSIEVSAAAESTAPAAASEDLASLSGSNEETSEAVPAADTATTASPESGEAADTQASDASTTVSTTADSTQTVTVAAETAEPLSPTMTALRVPMRDIKEIEPNAGGVVDFTFDTLTGQICYTVGSLGVNPPYAAHIHAGDFGVKGGVVVDLGQLENGSSGCVDNLPNDTNAILANPSRHYAELHDASGDWTVRGQLSETVDTPGIVPLTIPMRDILGTSVSSSGVLNFDFNTLTGEVCYSVFSVGVTPPFSGHIHAGAFGAKGGVVLDLGALDSGGQGCVENPLADTLAILVDPAGHYAELHDAGGEWTVRGQLTETIDNPGIVSLAVPMVDILNVEPTAAGTLTFDFNTVSGEICYDVTATNITAPFRSHIHAGDYGVKGGVVVDLGGLEDGSGGCVNNAIGDTLAILANPSGHYAELHDAGETWTIRGQLSEASAAIDPSSTNLLIDTDGGGAILRLENGIIFLDGDVASQAIADEMTSSLSGVATPVVNNLKIVPGAALPSGRVIIGDTVFFDTGSDKIKSLQPSTVTALVELANSRPDWVMAIVGHTDSIGSDVYNLELSLRRAEALRGVLADQGMNSGNIRIRGAGETAPIGDNLTEVGRAQNRRIEFEFTPA